MIPLLLEEVRVDALDLVGLLEGDAEDVHDGHDGPAAAFDSFVPARCDQADVLGAEKDEDSAPCVFFRPWFHVSRNRGYIREGTIFRDLRDYDEMSSEAVLSYLADVVPWDS